MAATTYVRNPLKADLVLVAPTSIEYEQWLSYIWIDGKRVINYEFYYSWQDQKMNLPHKA